MLVTRTYTRRSNLARAAKCQKQRKFWLCWKESSRVKEVQSPNMSDMAGSISFVKSAILVRIVGKQRQLQWLTFCDPKLETIYEQWVHDVSLNAQRRICVWQVSDVADDLNAPSTGAVRRFDNPELVRILRHFRLQQFNLWWQHECILHEFPAAGPMFLAHVREVLKRKGGNM